jgi:hypothetical protein
MRCSKVTWIGIFSTCYPGDFFVSHKDTNFVQVLLEPTSSVLVGACPSFNYSLLPTNEATQLRSTASSIRRRHSEIFNEAVSIGRELASAKRLLGHGRFGKWLEGEFSWSDRTARNYMALVTLVDELPEGKTETISDLPRTTLYLLGAPSTPSGVRCAVLGRLADGERLYEGEIEHLIKIEKCSCINSSTRLEKAAETDVGAAISNSVAAYPISTPNYGDEIVPRASRALVARVGESLEAIAVALPDKKLFRDFIERCRTEEGFLALREVIEKFAEILEESKELPSLPLAA